MRDEMKRRREELHLTQADLAEMIGIARSTYTNIELGQKNPSFSVMLRIKKALETSSDDIFLKTNVLIGNNDRQKEAS